MGADVRPVHRVRTYKPRRRQLTPARAELFDRLRPQLCLDAEGGRLDQASTFGRSAPLILDIGIGHGDSVTTAAAAEPDVDVIGVDVHTPGIASTLARIESMGLDNVRLVHGDALVFADRIEPGSVRSIRIYFPDPWHKARHRGRRMASPANFDLFCMLLAARGTLHVATDIADYAQLVQRLAGVRDELVGGRVERPVWRPVTRYERKALDAGRTVTDLIYHRR